MRHIAVAIALIIVMSLVVKGQCPTGYTKITKVYNIPDGQGGCCPVQVTFCYLSTANEFFVQYDTVAFFNSLCSNLFGPGLFNFITKRIIYEYDIGLTNCPVPTNKTLYESRASCFTTPSIAYNAGYPIVYIPCGESICQKICSYCKSTSETDPCSGEPMVVFLGCQYVTNTCVPKPGEQCNITACGF